MSKKYYWKCPHCEAEYKSEFSFIDHVCIDRDGVTRRELRGMSKPSKWHRVERADDEFPDTSRDVIVYCKDTIQKYCIGNFMNGEWTARFNNITHWRELPKPPKKAKEG